MRLVVGPLLGSILIACGGSTEFEPKGGSAAGSTGVTAGAGGSGGAAGAVTSSAVTTGAGGDASSASSASTGETTGAGGGGGVPDPWAGPVEHLKELDLGDVDLGVQRSFPIPDRTLGLTALVSAPSVDEVIGIARLKPPAVPYVIDNYAMAGHESQVFGNRGWVAGADPQSDSPDAMPVKEGYWRIWLGDDDGSIETGHVSVWVRRTEDGAFHGGAMDVNVFIAPGAADPGYMSQVLAGMFPYAGIDLGDVAYYALPAAYAVIDDHAEYRAMLASSAAVPTAPALNLFVVGDFGNAELGSAIGIAGGVPGSGVVHGTTMSGVAYAPSGDAGYDATVMAHEVGHLGGLFHTTEFQVVDTDSLSDTPACADATIQSNPDACPDQGNVMFPIAYGGSAFSAAQLAVIQGSALYRGAITAGGPPGAPVPMPLVPGASALAPIDPLAAGGGAAGPPMDAAPSAPRSAALVRALRGVRCSSPVRSTALRADHVDLAIAAAGARPLEALRAIALDPAAADLVRARALEAYARAAAGARPPERAAFLDVAAELAGDGRAAGRRLRVSALRAIGAHDAPRARILAGSIQARDDDPVVRAVAERVVSLAPETPTTLPKLQ